MPRVRQSKALKGPRLTLTQLAARMDSNHVAMMKEISGLKDVIYKAGLNGDSALLKEFLGDYKKQHDLKRSYGVVRADLGGRLRWLGAPKRLIVIFVTALVGALAWQIASGHGPHLPF